MTGPDEAVMMVLIRCRENETTTLMSENDTLIVMAAAYEDVTDAEADYEAVRALYNDVGASHEFDAVVLTRDESGEVRVVKKYEQPTRHGAADGLGWGLAIGAACAILPAVGLRGGFAVGGGAGAAIGAVTGYVKGGIDHEDLEALGVALGQGRAGLIVVYAVNMADQIAANIKSIKTAAVSKKIDANADELARQLREAAATSWHRRHSISREPSRLSANGRRGVVPPPC
jgi:uncharacterized membrane protein